MRLVIIQNLFFMSTIFHSQSIYPEVLLLDEWLRESFRPDKHSLYEQMVWIKEVVLGCFSQESEVQIFVSVFHIAVFYIRSLNQRKQQLNSYWYKWKTEMGRTGSVEAICHKSDKKYISKHMGKVRPLRPEQSHGWFWLCMIKTCFKR